MGAGYVEEGELSQDQAATRIQSAQRTRVAYNTRQATTGGGGGGGGGGGAWRR